MRESIVIRTKSEPHFYIHELRGVVYLSWVSENDVAKSCIFPYEKINKWVDIIQDQAGFEVEAVYYPSYAAVLKEGIANSKKNVE
jgi:hypothetical protein